MPRPKAAPAATDPEQVRIVPVRVSRTLTISISPTLQAFLRVLAEKEDRNLSRVVERLVKKGLTAEGIPFEEETSP